MSIPEVIAAAENLGLDMEEYADFLNDLAESVASEKEKLKQYINEKNGDGASGVAHSIKGATGSLGLMKTYEACQTLETKYKEGIDDNSIQMANDMFTIYDEEFAHFNNGV